MSFDDIQNNKLKLLGKLTAGLLHEIRNPLSAIKLNLDLVKYYEKELPVDVTESINDCWRATERIEDLIENLLQYARKSNNEIELVSLNEVTSTTVHLLKLKASKKNIKLTTELENEIPLIRLNENKLLQVLLNLVTNAIDACDINGSVCVRTYVNNSLDLPIPQWQVSDNGVGISEENKAKIFDDFFTSKSTGTGLGLTVCKSLLEEMNAKIEFESKVNFGTTFTVSFLNKTEE
jgi:signal transduction histidine kinase